MVDDPVRYVLRDGKLKRLFARDERDEPLLIPSAYYRVGEHSIRRDARGRFIKPIRLLERCGRDAADYTVAEVYFQMGLGEQGKRKGVSE